jgi:hypothetical protein
MNTVGMMSKNLTMMNRKRLLAAGFGLRAALGGSTGSSAVWAVVVMYLTSIATEERGDPRNADRPQLVGLEKTLAV